MARSRLALALALAVAGVAAPAWAADLPSGGVTRQEVANWLTSNGHPATVSTVSTGSRVVSSSIGGVNFDIYFYSCAGERCLGLQYAAGWSGMESTPLDTINSFTRDNRYLRVYKSGGSLWAEYDVDVAPGATWEQLDNSLLLADDLFKRFKTHFGL